MVWRCYRSVYLEIMSFHECMQRIQCFYSAQVGPRWLQDVSKTPSGRFETTLRCLQLLFKRFETHPRRGLEVLQKRLAWKSDFSWMYAASSLLFGPSSSKILPRRLQHAIRTLRDDSEMSSESFQTLSNACNTWLGTVIEASSLKIRFFINVCIEFIVFIRPK